MKRLVDDLVLVVIVTLSLVTLAYIIVPIVVSFAMSFDARTYLGPFPPRRLSLQWYGRLFSNEHFIEGFRTSLLLAIVATGISAVVGVMAAVAVSQHEFRGKALLSSFFLSPLMVPAVVLGFGLVMFLGYLGVFVGFVRLLAGHVLITLPYTIRATLAGLTGIRPSLREAAMTLGANERQVFWDITFPLAKTGIVAGCVFAFASSLDDVRSACSSTTPTATRCPSPSSATCAPTSTSASQPRPSSSPRSRSSWSWSSTAPSG